MSSHYIDFDSVVYGLTELHIADASQVYLKNGTGLADESGKEPDLIACRCEIVPEPNVYVRVDGKNASGEYLYGSRLQYVASRNGLQFFKFQK